MATNLDDHIKGDQRSKQFVILTICGIAWCFALTACILALREIVIPPEIKELTLFILGVISGSLIKTAVDRASAPEVPLEAPLPVVGPDGGPVPVTETEPSEGEPQPNVKTGE